MSAAAERENFWQGWRERISALRDVPPVLRIVWQSGPLVVSLGIIFRVFASVLPIGLLWIAKLIIDSIVNALRTHQPVEQGFWWLVAGEFALAVFGSILNRAIAEGQGARPMAEEIE